MANAILEVKTFLDALGTLGTITMESMPDKPDVICTLYEYPGRVPQYRFGVVGVGWEDPGFQLAFRGVPHDSATPRATADLAYRALAAHQVGTLGSSSAEYLWIEIQQQPFKLKKDLNERFYYVFNFYTRKELS